jgi:putative acyl-CoA dehydrogenase
MDFYQSAPRLVEHLSNAFQSDRRLVTLAEALRTRLDAQIYQDVVSQWQRCGQLALTEWLSLSELAERELPRHIAFDAWGRRIDEIQMSRGWRELEAVAAREGIVATAYEKKQGEYSRVVQGGLLYLFHASSAFVSCPLAMTDGAARALELYGSEDQKRRLMSHLISRDPANFWTSGQWMTERSGGSDVSGTSTTARRVGSTWTLEGVKWFTSATNSQMSLLLARPEGAEAGSRGLSLFALELRQANGKLRDIEVLRLKDKLGTKALPTAELRLKGAPAELLGGEGHGVKKISALLNITRYYNSVCATAHMRRALDLAQVYSDVRIAFGRKLREHPLHASTLAKLEREFEKCFDLTFFVAHLLGREEVGVCTEEERILLRAMTPIVKAYTAKRCMEIVSEVVEIFGGAGYVEDTGIPKLLRDAQVFSIWEGTTNVLALDLVRALAKEGAGPVLLRFLEKQLGKGSGDAADVQASIRGEMQKWTQLLASDPSQLEPQARDLLFAVAELLALAVRTHWRVL